MSKDNKCPGFLVAPSAGQGLLQAENSNSSPLIELIAKTLELCRSLQAENDFLRKELERQYLIRALLERTYKPKKRGRKPKPKPEIDNAPKKRGRPSFSEETLNLLIECVDGLKQTGEYKSDKDALIYLLHEHYGRYGWSNLRAQSKVNKWQTRLSKARRKKRQAETEQQPND
jgi:hypothetical protein